MDIAVLVTIDPVEIREGSRSGGPDQVGAGDNVRGAAVTLEWIEPLLTEPTHPASNSHPLLRCKRQLTANLSLRRARKCSKHWD
jgi:hypothetical protein